MRGALALVGGLLLPVACGGEPPAEEAVPEPQPAPEPVTADELFELELVWDGYRDGVEDPEQLVALVREGGRIDAPGFWNLAHTRAVRGDLAEAVVLLRVGLRLHPGDGR